MEANKSLMRQMIKAIEDKDAATVRSLLVAGFDAGISLAHNETALHWAARNNNPEIIRLLIDAGANVSARTGWGSVPLQYAAGSGNAENCRLLLEAGADVECREGGGTPPLHSAAIARAADVCMTLIQYGANVNAVSVKGETPLCVAVVPNAGVGYIADEAKVFDVCVILAKAGANASFVKENAPDDYLTPFQSAVKYRLKTVVQALVELAGEDPAQSTLDGRNMTKLPGRLMMQEKKEWKEFWNSMKTEHAIRKAMLADDGAPQVKPDSRADGLSPL